MRCSALARCVFSSALLIVGLTNQALLAQETTVNENVLVIGTWGGPYEAAQRDALFTPFEKASGLLIRTSDYTGGLHIFSEPAVPDILDMVEDEAAVACQAGYLRAVNYEALSDAKEMKAKADPSVVNADGFARHDFYPGVFAPCSVAHLTFSTVIAYDERAFPGEKPQRIPDFFNLERYPGKRALQRSPAALFEWAMMAEGVPIAQIYKLLSTERGLRLVLRKLESLRGHIIWWDDPAEAVALLERGDVVMASGYNGRFFDAWSRGSPINMIWDGQIIDRSVWVIATESAIDTRIAESFIRFALHPERLARIATQIPYGPVRSSAFHYIGLHPDSGIVMRDHLPTAEHHLDNALYRDTRWYAKTSRLREAYFSRWIEGVGSAKQ